MPSTSHQALASTLAGVAGPLSRMMKAWSSSIVLPAQGWTCTTAGPPVEKLNSLRPVSAPAAASGFQSARSLSVQRLPGGNGSRKSNSQVRSLAQRPVPGGAPPSQLNTIGSGWRRSPSGTTASENFTFSWRTCATSP